MAVLGLRFCARAFSSCSKRGPLFIAVHRPPTIAASPVAEHRLETHTLSNCGSRTHLLHGMWDPPRPGLEPVSPASAGIFSTTAPPGKSQDVCSLRQDFIVINFPLRTAFAASHRFWVVVFSLSFVSRYFLISSLICSVISWLLSTVLFSLHVFVIFTDFFPVIDIQSHSIVVGKDM